MAAIDSGARRRLSQPASYAERARRAERLAREAGDPATRAAYEDMARVWRGLEADGWPVLAGALNLPGGEGAAGAE